MSKNYDNWERLVTVVLRRQHDRELAMCSSRDNSTVSDISSSLNLDFDTMTTIGDLLRLQLSSGEENIVQADRSSSKLTVPGRVDLAWIRERFKSKTKKKVKLISPQPRKDGDHKKVDDDDQKQENKADDKEKPKDQPVVSTVVMKINLHCVECENKIKRDIRKNVYGVSSVTTDSERDLVTVVGTMDVQGLATYLKEKLKRGVEIVPPKKADEGGDKKAEDGPEEEEEKEGGGGDGGEKKDKKEKGKEKSEGEKKEVSDDKKEGEAKATSGGDGPKVEANKFEYFSYNPQTHYAMPMYNQAYANYDHYGHYGMPMYNQPYANYDHYGVPMYYYYNQGYPYTGSMVEYARGPPLPPPPPPPPPMYQNHPNHNGMFTDGNPNECAVM